MVPGKFCLFVWVPQLCCYFSGSVLLDCGLGILQGFPAAWEACTGVCRGARGGKPKRSFLASPLMQSSRWSSESPIRKVLLGEGECKLIRGRKAFLTLKTSPRQPLAAIPITPLPGAADGHTAAQKQSPAQVELHTFQKGGVVTGVVLRNDSRPLPFLNT